MDVNMAAFRLVRDFPGGAQALAGVVGKSATSLSHEVNPNYPGAKLGLADAVTLSEWTGDRQVLNAFAANMSCMVVPLVAAVPGAEGAAAYTATLASEFGQLMAACAAGLADGTVTDNERAHIEREGAELMSALQRLLGEVRAINVASKPQAEQLKAGQATEPLKAVA
jgi:hypothetical protein